MPVDFQKSDATMTAEASHKNPFILPRKTPFGLVERVVEKATGLTKMGKTYASRPEELDLDGFLDFVLSSLQIDYQITMGDTSTIPTTGPTVVVANHPSGGVEGVILAKLLLSVRPDVKILANEFLKMIPELDDLFIGVDVFGKQAVKRNTAPLRATYNHLKEGGLLLIFPAGEVSDMHRRQHHNVIEDGEWSKSVASLVRKNKATTVPIYIDDKNSRLFYMARRMRPVFGTLLLGRELLRKRNKVVKIRFSSPIPFGEVANMEMEQMVQYMRLNTYMMAPHTVKKRRFKLSKKQHVVDPIADFLPKSQVAENIAMLPDEAKLFSQDEFDVYCTTYDNLDALAHELGRCREYTFRDNQQGTGKPLDLDKFDEYYHHLIIWNREEQEIMGAYRLGLADTIIHKKGIRGMYTRHLFRFRKKFLMVLNPEMKVMELGRSFIMPKYQGHRSGLLMLWRGIGMFISRHPDYTHLFGPVSIGSEYTLEARHLMSQVLRKYYCETDAAHYVSSYKDLPNIPLHWTEDMLGVLECTNHTSAVVERNNNGKSIPILLRQYLRLNGKIAGFNVDPNFNNTLDCLIIVDIRNIPLRSLNKYMGKEATQSYLLHHKLVDEKMAEK